MGTLRKLDKPLRQRSSADFDLARVGRTSWRRFAHHLGFAGHCQLDGAVARLLQHAPLDALSLKIGINVLCDDTMRERTFVPAVHAFLDVIRDGHPDIPIVVVSPIFCPALEENPGPVRVDASGNVETIVRSPELGAGALTGRRVRELLTEVVGQRATSDDHLTFIDGRELLGPDEVAGLYDGLHPDEEQHSESVTASSTGPSDLAARSLRSPSHATEHRHRYATAPYVIRRHVLVRKPRYAGLRRPCSWSPE